MKEPTSYLSGAEVKTVAETLDHYGLRKSPKAWAMVEYMARYTGRPFRAYDAAHSIAAGIKQAERQRGAVSLPLLTFQACAAIGLASGLWSLYLRLAAQIGGFGL